MTDLDSPQDLKRKLIFVVGALDDLKKRGVVTGSTFAMTDNGTSIYDQLLADGFNVTHSEMADLMMEGDLVYTDDDAYMMAAIWKTMHHLERAIMDSGMAYTILSADD